MSQRTLVPFVARMLMQDVTLYDRLVARKSKTPPATVASELRRRTKGMPWASKELASPSHCGAIAAELDRLKAEILADIGIGGVQERDTPQPATQTA